MEAAGTAAHMASCHRRFSCAVDDPMTAAQDRAVAEKIATLTQAMRERPKDRWTHPRKSLVALGEWADRMATAVDGVVKAAASSKKRRAND
jgi:hypothetical protein